MIEFFGFDRKSVIFWTILFWSTQVIMLAFWPIWVWILVQIIVFLISLICTIETKTEIQVDRDVYVILNQSALIIVLALAIEPIKNGSINFKSSIEKFNNWLDGKQKDDSCTLPKKQ